MSTASSEKKHEEFSVNPEIGNQTESVAHHHHVTIDPVLEKQTMRKVDWRLLPILGALYSFSLIDRSNLGLIYVAGAAVDLGLTNGNRYSVAILMFFVPYIILELPANLVIRRVGSAVWLSTIALLWGAVMVGMGFVKNWQGLAGTRAALGALEAGFFPACAWLVSSWYTRREMQLRLAIFYLVSVLAGGFSAILAYGLTQLHGRNGLEGWRWVLIVEGIITMGLALIAYFVIVDFPDKNKFLTPEQTALVKARIDQDRGDVEYDHVTAAKLVKYAMDMKIWLFALLFMGSTVPAYAFSSFLPVILGGMGKSVSESQLLAAPPYVVAVAFALIAAWACDRYGNRGFFLIGQALLCTVGLLMTAYADNNDARYAGVFLGLSGCQANVPCVLAYQSTNITKQSKRSFSNAIVVAFGGIGGIYSALVFRNQDRPKYIPGLWATVACQIMIVLITLGLNFHFNRENKRLREGKRGPIEDQENFYFTP